VKAAIACLVLVLVGSAHGAVRDASSPSAGGSIAFASRRDGDFDIFLMRPDGRGVRQLTHNATVGRNENDDHAPAWSRDGRLIVFQSTRDHEGDGSVDMEIYVMNADGSEQRRLTANEAPELSPDWTEEGRIIFTTCAFDQVLRCELVSTTAEGADLRTLLTLPPCVSYAALSPDGTRVAFAQPTPCRAAQPSAPRTSQIVVMNLDGSGRTQLTRARGWSAEPRWSPDGRKIALVSDRDRNGACLFHDCSGFAGEIYVMNADGTQERRLTRYRGVDANPVWSPNGTRIAFIRILSEQDDYEIHVMNADGSCQRALTKNKSADWAPDWYGPRQTKARLSC
jgi:Tol biopolymer transport system component